MILSLVILFIASFDDLKFFSSDYHLSYGYYQILRFLVCGTSFYNAYLFYKKNRREWMWILMSIGALFNPIAPIRLDQETWRIIDFIVGIIFLVLVFVSRKTRK